MSRCKKCGSGLKWKMLASGKWCPVNPDGTDHWDLCRSITRGAEGPTVVFHMRTKGKGTHVWDSELPPWDESLGAFRGFTKAEMQAEEICRRHP